VQLLLQLLAQHDSDPRANLTLKIELERDKDTSALTKTSELLGRGVNMIKDLSLFSIESKRQPLLVLNLVPIRCDTAAALRSTRTSSNALCIMMIVC
jgi:hypothetical protein